MMFSKINHHQGPLVVHLVRNILHNLLLLIRRSLRLRFIHLSTDALRILALDLVSTQDNLQIQRPYQQAQQHIAPSPGPRRRQAPGRGRSLDSSGRGTHVPWPGEVVPWQRWWTWARQSRVDTDDGNTDISWPIMHPFLRKTHQEHSPTLRVTHHSLGRSGPCCALVLLLPVTTPIAPGVGWRCEEFFPSIRLWKREHDECLQQRRV